MDRRQQIEGTRVVDTPERVRARAARLAQAGQLPPKALLKAIALSEPAWRCEARPTIHLEDVLLTWPDH